MGEREIVLDLSCIGFEADIIITAQGRMANEQVRPFAFFTSAAPHKS